MESKEVFVKAHTRIIKQRVYRFVCKNCNQVVERTCYPSLPLYCLECRPQKAKASLPNRKAIARIQKKIYSTTTSCRRIYRTARWNRRLSTLYSTRCRASVIGE